MKNLTALVIGTATAAWVGLAGCKVPTSAPSSESAQQAAATAEATGQLARVIQGQAASNGVGGTAGTAYAPILRALQAGTCPIITYSNTCTTAASSAACSISFDADYGPSGCPGDPANHRGEVGSVLSRTGGSENGTLNFHATKYSEGAKRTLDGSATVAVTVTGGSGTLQIQANGITATDPTTGEVLTFTINVTLGVTFGSTPTMDVVTIKSGSTATSTSSKGGTITVTATSDVPFDPNACPTEPLTGTMSLGGTDSAGNSFSGWEINFADGACDEQAIVQSGDFTVHVKFRD